MIVAVLVIVGVDVRKGSVGAGWVVAVAVDVVVMVAVRLARTCMPPDPAIRTKPRQ